MKKCKKGKFVISTICMAFMAVTFSNLNVSAASISATNPKAFDAPWERYISSEDGKATLTYGFNQFAINEDYAWATHATKNHYASLKNGNGWYTGPNKGAGSTSKIEVTHNGTSVSYYCNY